MQHTKVFKLFSALAESKNNLKELKLYFLGQQTDKNNLLVDFFCLLITYYKTPNHRNFQKEQIFTKLYDKKEPYQDSKLNALFNRVCRIMENFIVDKAVRDNAILYDLLLANGFQQLSIEKSFYQRVIRGIKGSLPQEEARRALALSIAYKALYYHPRSTEEDKKEYQTYLDLALQYELEYFMLEHLKHSCEKLTLHRFYGALLKEGFYENLSKLIAKVTKDDLPLIQLFVLTTNFLQDINLKSYTKLKTSFFKQYDNIHSEQDYILTCLLNGLYVFGHPNRLEEFFELHQFGLNNNLFVENSVIKVVDYNNIIRVFCAKEKIEAAENFANTHFQYLKVAPDKLESIKARSLCTIAFAKKDYKTVLYHLEEINFQDHNHIIDRYILEFKTNYELGITHEIYTRKRAFHDYLRDNHRIKVIGSDYKTCYENFYKLLDMLINARINGHSKQDLLDTLASFEGLIAEAQWLSKKIEERFPR